MIYSINEFANDQAKIFRQNSTILSIAFGIVVYYYTRDVMEVLWAIVTIMVVCFVVQIGMIFLLATVLNGWAWLKKVRGR